MAALDAAGAASLRKPASYHLPRRAISTTAYLTSYRGNARAIRTRAVTRGPILISVRNEIRAHRVTSSSSSSYALPSLDARLATGVGGYQPPASLANAISFFESCGTRWSDRSLVTYHSSSPPRGPFFLPSRTYGCPAFPFRSSSGLCWPTKICRA